MYPSLFQFLVFDAQKTNLWLPIAAQVISWRLEGSFVEPVLPLSTPKHPETQKPRNPQQSNDPTDHTHTSRRLLGLFARLSVGRISKKCIVTLWLGSVLCSGFKLGQVCILFGLLFSCDLYDLAQLWCQSTCVVAISLGSVWSACFPRFRSRGICMAGVGSWLTMEKLHLRTLRIMFPGRWFLLLFLDLKEHCKIARKCYCLDLFEARVKRLCRCGISLQCFIYKDWCANWSLRFQYEQS